MLPPPAPRPGQIEKETRVTWSDGGKTSGVACANKWERGEWEERGEREASLRGKWREASLSGKWGEASLRGKFERPNGERTDLVAHERQV